MEALTRGTAHLDTGVTVPYVSIGDAEGPPLVLLHGWGESAGVFERLLPGLPERYRVFAFDQRGHGEATKPHSGYALKDTADDVRAFLDAVGVEFAVLLGSSSGGYIAQQVAVSWPPRVKALILVGAPRSLAGTPSFAAEVNALSDPIDPAWVRQSLEWFPLAAPVPEEYLNDRVRDGVRTPAHVWQMALAGFGSARAPTEVGEILCPTLIIRGERDEVIPDAEHEALARSIPGSQLRRYSDTGHLVLWERPDLVAADVTEFLAGVTGHSS
ncbi:alpha/beta fold hydrolase [Mycetocola sp.]|uniref:alpha/beta fold hydrolase n=1 Tax=Mycetocola sp. TaxID=1871042 RepID=UPI00398A01FB